MWHLSICRPHADPRFMSSPFAQMTDATELQIHDSTFSHDLTLDGFSCVDCVTVGGRAVNSFYATPDEADAIVWLTGFNLDTSKFSNLTFLTPTKSHQALRSDVGLHKATGSLWDCPQGRYMPTTNPLLGFFRSCQYIEDDSDAFDCCELDASAGLCTAGYFGAETFETSATCSVGNYCPEGPCRVSSCPARVQTIVPAQERRETPWWHVQLERICL